MILTYFSFAASIYLFSVILRVHLFIYIFIHTSSPTYPPQIDSPPEVISALVLPPCDGWDPELGVLIPSVVTGGGR